MQRVYDLISHLDRMTQYMPDMENVEIGGERPASNDTKVGCVVEASEGRGLIYETVIRDYAENRFVGSCPPRVQEIDGLRGAIGQNRTRVHFRIE